MPTAVAPLSNKSRIGVRQLAPAISPTAEALGGQTCASLTRFLEHSQAVPYCYRLTGMPVIFDPLNEVLRPTLERLKSLLRWEAGWNGYDAPTPDKEALVQAGRWIVKMWLAAAGVRRPWSEPNISGGSEGEVVFEWWQDERKLTVYVSAEGAEYVKVWGPDIHSQMADGEADSAQERQAIWSWLMGE